MIPETLFMALFFTLVLIILGVSGLYLPIKNDKSIIAISCIIAVAVINYILAALGEPTWLGKILATFIGAIAGYGYYSAKNSKEENTEVESSNDSTVFPFINKVGYVIMKYGDNSYLGKLQESKEQIVVYCNEELKPNDVFLITHVEGNKIIANKMV